MKRYSETKMKDDAAARKDELGARYPAKLQHRHFAVIAKIIKDMDTGEGVRAGVAYHFAAELAETNPKFDRTRFLDACGVEV